MKDRSFFLTLALVCCSYLLAGQEGQKRSVSTLPFFIDGDLGALVILDDYGPAFAHLSLGAGYRFNARRAIGLEYRWAYSSADYYNPYTGRGLGVTYRSTRGGLYFKASLGLEINPTNNTYESPFAYDAEGGSLYHGLTLAYHFRSGILLGITATSFFNRTFRRRELILSPEYEREYQDTGYFPFLDVRDAPEDAGHFVARGERTFNFVSPTLTIGYAFPGRGKKKLGSHH